jgi:hypothetical protein
MLRHHLRLCFRQSRGVVLRCIQYLLNSLHNLQTGLKFHH